MLRVLVFLALLCVAAYGAVWLADNPETVAVTWAGREYSISLAIGVVGFVASALLLSFALGAVRYLVSLPVHVGRANSRRREKRGRHALTRGIVAIGAGDIAAARRYAGEAERLLTHEPLALLLKAQAAQASGNREAAEAAFRRMVESPDTRVLGLRGLYLEARRRGDLEEARTHADAAARAAPAIEWANEAVLAGLSGEGDWAGALGMVERRTSLGLVDRSTSRRQRAVLLAADALSREEADPVRALAGAEAAVKLAPDLVPSAALAARLLSRNGDVKRAAKIIESAWAANPHPELAGAYLNLRSGDSAMDRLRRAETLARLSSWSDEARFAIARAAIEARELPRAREALRPLLDSGSRPTVRLCMAMAEIEGRGGDAGGAREWLARAARAPRDKAWMADGVVSDRWAPVSPVTGRLDAYVWDTPPDLLGSSIDPDLSRFEPDHEMEPDLPAFLGRPGSSERAPPPEPEPAEAEPVRPSGPVRGRSHPLAELDPPPAPEPPAPTRAHPLAELPTRSRQLPLPPAQPASFEETTILAEPAPVRPTQPDAVRPADDRPAKAPPDAARPGPATVVGPSTIAGSGASKTASAPVVDPGPVIFPVHQAPDDPGAEPEEDRRQRFRLRV